MQDGHVEESHVSAVFSGSQQAGERIAGRDSLAVKASNALLAVTGGGICDPYPKQDSIQVPDLTLNFYNCRLVIRGNRFR